MHHCGSVILLVVRPLPLHRVVEHLQSSLYGLVIIRPFVKLVQRVLRGRGGEGGKEEGGDEGGGRGLWYSVGIAELVSY